MYELFMCYIGSSWFLENEKGPIYLMGVTTCFAMIYMVKLTVSMSNLSESNSYTFLYSFVGCNVLGFAFYGYVAMPFSIFWVIHVNQLTKERAKYYYIRELYGHTGRWHEASDIDATIDYDRLIDEITFDEEEMKKFYSSDTSAWMGWAMAIFVIFVSSIMFEGYMFLPKAFVE